MDHGSFVYPRHDESGFIFGVVDCSYGLAAGQIKKMCPLELALRGAQNTYHHNDTSKTREGQ